MRGKFLPGRPWLLPRAIFLWHRAVCKATARDIVIAMGDFSAKIGSNNKGYELVMGKQATGSMNENGEKLADFCLDNNLAIWGSIFLHKTIHKNTRVSPDHVRENQTDFICYSRKFRRSLLDTGWKEELMQPLTFTYWQPVSNWNWRGTKTINKPPGWSIVFTCLRANKSKRIPANIE